MPVCPECQLGIPPWIDACPDCGRTVVEIAIEEVEIAPPVEIEAEVPEIEVVPEPVVEVTVLPVIESIPEPETIELPDTPEPEVIPEEPEPPQPEEIDDFADLEIEVDDDVDLEDEIEEPEEEVFVPGLSPEQLLKLDELVRQASEQTTGLHWTNTVRWRDRAYRGDLELTSPNSAAAVTTLAVFGDGLVLVDSRSLGSGVLAGLHGRKDRKVFTLAAGSADAESQLAGSQRLALNDIESVRLATAHGRTLDIALRITTGEELHYGCAASKHHQLVGLLAPVLGVKLEDTVRARETPGRAR